jgi:hypothetical protein
MDYISWLFGYTTSTPMTTTVFKNKHLMNNINNELVSFNKNTLKKVETKQNTNILTEIRNFKKSKLKETKTQYQKEKEILNNSISTIDYNFSSDSDMYETYDDDWDIYNYNITLADIIKYNNILI